MKCLRCGTENSEAVEFCTKCGNHIARTQQQTTQPPAKSRHWRVLAAASGMVLLYSMSLAFIYHFRLDGGSPNSAAWFVSVTWAACATTILGFTVYRYSSSVSESPGSIPRTTLILASSMWLIALELVLLLQHLFDAWFFDGDYSVIMIITIGPVMGTITAIEWNRLVGSVGYMARVLSTASIIPAYLLAVVFIYWMIFPQFGATLI